MSKTIDAKIALSDEQYEAFQVIHRLDADSVDKFVTAAVVGGMQAHLFEYIPDQPIYKRLKALIET